MVTARVGGEVRASRINILLTPLIQLNAGRKLTIRVVVSAKFYIHENPIYRIILQYQSSISPSQCCLLTFIVKEYIHIYTSINTIIVKF